MKYFILIIILSLTLSAKETRYSRAIADWEKSILAPIRPKIPKMMKVVAQLKKIESEKPLSKNQKKLLEDTVYQLKKYNCVTQLSEIYSRCHKDASLLPDFSDDNIDQKKQTQEQRAAERKLHTYRTEILALFKKYPKVTKEPLFVKVLRDSYNKKSKNKKKSK